MTAVRRRIPITVLFALALVVVTAAPAAAHGIEGIEATNYRTRITSVSPAVDGLTVRVVEAGSRLELVNRTGEDVVVRGYQDEPYLRIDAQGGVFVNRRSPAAYINADREGSLEPPPDADPSANPEWDRTDDGMIARWHDHRAHWMGQRDAPAVRNAPDRRHVVIPRWEVKLDIGRDQTAVVGDLTWIPGPSGTPWLALAAALAALLVIVDLFRPSRLFLAGAVGLLVLLDLFHIAGKAAAGSGGFAAGVGGVLSGSFFSVAAWAAGGLAVRLLLRGSPDGPFAAAFAGAIIALFGGVADLPDLTRSQVPFAYGDVPARLLVALSLGLGLGLVIAAAVRVHREPLPAAPS